MNLIHKWLWMWNMHPRMSQYRPSFSFPGALYSRKLWALQSHWWESDDWSTTECHLRYVIIHPLRNTYNCPTSFFQTDAMKTPDDGYGGRSHLGALQFVGSISSYVCSISCYNMYVFCLLFSHCNHCCNMRRPMCNPDSLHLLEEEQGVSWIHTNIHSVVYRLRLFNLFLSAQTAWNRAAHVSESWSVRRRGEREKHMYFYHIYCILLNSSVHTRIIKSLF